MPDTDINIRTTADTSGADKTAEALNAVSEASKTATESANQQAEAAQTATQATTAQAEATQTATEAAQAKAQAEAAQKEAELAALDALKAKYIELQAANKAAREAGDEKAKMATVRELGKLGDEIEKLTNKINGVAEALDNLDEGGDALDAVGDKLDKVGKKAGKDVADGAKKGAGAIKNMGGGALQAAYFFDDLQYGIKGVMNNIPGLVMGLGGGMGLAGVLSIATLAGTKLYEWMSDGESKTVDLTAKTKEYTEALNESTKAVEKERIDRLTDAHLERITQQIEYEKDLTNEVMHRIEMRKREIALMSGLYDLEDEKAATRAEIDYLNSPQGLEDRLTYEKKIAEIQANARHRKADEASQQAELELKAAQEKVKEAMDARTAAEANLRDKEVEKAKVDDLGKAVPSVKELEKIDAENGVAWTEYQKIKSKRHVLDVAEQRLKIEQDKQKEKGYVNKDLIDSLRRDVEGAKSWYAKNYGGDAELQKQYDIANSTYARMQDARKALAKFYNVDESELEDMDKLKEYIAKFEDAKKAVTKTVDDAGKNVSTTQAAQDKAMQGQESATLNSTAADRRASGEKEAASLNVEKVEAAQSAARRKEAAKEAEKARKEAAKEAKKREAERKKAEAKRKMAEGSKTDKLISGAMFDTGGASPQRAAAMQSALKAIKPAIKDALANDGKIDTKETAELLKLLRAELDKNHTETGRSITALNDQLKGLLSDCNKANKAIATVQSQMRHRR